jgi:hypothetical protein
MSMKVPPTLFRRSTDFINLAEQLKADVEQLRLEKQTAFETQTEEWRSSEKGDRLADDIALLEDVHDALKTVLHQLSDLFTPET